MILLDMNMQEKNGIEVAKELRSQKIETPIIYISAYIEMAPYGYVVNAFRYLLKNDLEETFCFAMDDVMKELKHHLETIEVRTENVQIELRLSDIVFVESYKRYVLIHTKKDEYKQYGKISDMEKNALSKKNFCGYTKVISSNLEPCGKNQKPILFLDNGRGSTMQCKRAVFRKFVQSVCDLEGEC